VKDKEAFKSAIEQAQRQTAAKPDNTAYYIDSLMSEEIERFKADKKTGFPALDAKAGGLYTGLYVLAAISSLGKTSFALQLADQLAENGNDVIFFSLEQSRLELVSKSIARKTAQTDSETAVTSLQIRKGYLPEQVIRATQDYKKAVADRISVVEGNFSCDISFIGDYTRRYINQNNTRPIIIIDYLQILQPADDKRQTTKEVVDTTMTELKRLSREQDLTIIAISSINRTNYLTPISFESLKESGCIEYSCDVLWGLQLQCLNESDYEKLNQTDKRKRVDEEKARTPRKIELSCIKNRYGISSYSCYFDYYQANDLFEEEKQ
jgi:replicative DNA helicase